MADTRACSCGGSNENCARCYGRGFIEGGPTLAGRKDSSSILATGRRRRRRKKGLSQSGSQKFASPSPPSPPVENEYPKRHKPKAMVRVRHVIAEVIQRLRIDRLSELGARG